MDVHAMGNTMSDNVAVPLASAWGVINQASYYDFRVVAIGYLKVKCLNCIFRREVSFASKELNWENRYSFDAAIDSSAILINYTVE